MLEASTGASPSIAETPRRGGSGRGARGRPVQLGKSPAPSADALDAALPEDLPLHGGVDQHRPAPPPAEASRRPRRSRIVVGRVPGSLEALREAAASCSMKSGFPSRGLRRTAPRRCSRSSGPSSSSSEFGELACLVLGQRLERQRRVGRAARRPTPGRSVEQLAAARAPAAGSGTSCRRTASISTRSRRLGVAPVDVLEDEAVGSSRAATASTKTRRTREVGVSRSATDSPSSRARARSRCAGRRPRLLLADEPARRACASFASRDLDVVALEDPGELASAVPRTRRRRCSRGTAGDRPWTIPTAELDAMRCGTRRRAASCRRRRRRAP